MRDFDIDSFIREMEGNRASFLALRSAEGDGNGDMKIDGNPYTDSLVWF
jgi:hypothetical protein